MIPRILHQTWKDAAVPAGFSKYVESWKRFHPGWEFKFWTDADLAEFVDSRCPETSHLFHSYPKPVMRADLGRYLLLREFGGVYADIDAEAMADFSPLLDSEAPVFAYEPRSHAALDFVRSRGFLNIVSNAVIASPPAHPFWNHLLSLMHRCRSSDNPFDSTGPIVVTAAVEQAPEAAAARVLPAHIFCPIDKFGVPVNRGRSPLPSFAFHHWAGTWRKPDVASGPAAQPATKLTAQDLAASAAGAERFLRSIDRAIVDAEKQKKGNVLIAVSVRDAAATVDRLLDRLLALRYPRGNLSLAVLETDSSDGTLDRLNSFARLHGNEFRKIGVIKRDFGAAMPKPGWAPAMNRSQRSHMARLRNELIRQGLHDEDWVLWLDAGTVAFPDDILTTLLSAGTRIVHPNTVRTAGGASIDLNAWTSERPITVQAIAAGLKDGLYQPPTGSHRLYLSDMRYRDVVNLHGVGGGMLLADADLHRAGLLFPEQPYRFLIDTEAFGVAASEIGIFSAGLPNVEIVHSVHE